MFRDRILPVTEDVMLRWRMIVEEERKIRHTFSQPDLIIAATALEHGLTLATGDIEDDRKTGAAPVNPWTGATIAG